ncbi:hypothetical protein BH10CYA1_BH10CYA1_38240 [soil metagenome]
MVVSAQSQSTSYSAFQSIAQINFQTGELCIIGDGAISLAAGCILSGGKQNLRIWSPKQKSVQNKQLPVEFEIRERGSHSVGMRVKTAFSVVSDDCKTALGSAEAVVIATPATEYGVLAKTLAPFLKIGQTIYLVNAPVAGGLEFSNRIKSINEDLQLNIIELGGLFDHAKIVDGVLLITGQREKISMCGNSRNETRRGLEIANTLSRELVPCSNVLERGFSEVERLIRPALLLFAVLGARGRDLDCISNSVNPALTSVVVAMETELAALAKVFKCIVHNFFDQLNDFNGAEDADCLDQALISVARSLLVQSLSAQTSSDSIPVEVAIDILKRDVCETLVLISELGRLSRTPVPVINSVIQLASTVSKTDLEKQGRTLGDLGLLGFDVHEVGELINA